ncbi:SGNH/GDSL hydrolase N-terminal domain-containing protein [Paenibacillus puerhi]|uniref:SGNH/GDSL hydrolase N-terminal domain-containing protein n=1 Tax=Paenibacillus puerhi TaxID=2692622 RepID=UPI001914F01B|nr:SGNH/GDSL hydrolase N-terminal domain-containing protein [Paenibacillus puerhi]
MKTYPCYEKPFSLHGLNHIQPDTGEYWRFPLDILKLMPQYEHLGRRCAGARLRFRTDASRIIIRYSLKTE